MICPHCSKPIEYGVSSEIYKEAKKMKDKGMSLRDIEKIFFTRGLRVSASSLSRAFNGQLKKLKRGNE